MSSFFPKSLPKLTEKLTNYHFKFEKSLTDDSDIMSIDIEIVHKLLKNDPDPVTHYYRDDYDTIYTMSDIHADYKTFLTHLQNFGIIERANIDDIYNISNITDVEWKCGPRTLLVICGDIVDGKRGNVEVKDDNQGLYEILLHAFLRNLKISAQEKGSDVILLYGNHDVRMFKFRHTDIPDGMTLKMIEKFMHTNAKKRYNKYVNKEKIYIQHSNHIRAYILKPFYKQFTLFFGIVNKGFFKNKFDMLFIHGGFHNKSNTKDMLISIENLQDNLMKNFDNNEVFQSIMNELSKPDSAMWTRYYTEGNFIKKQNPKECDKVKNFPTVIVGHCQNSNHNYLQNDDDERPCTKTILRSPQINEDGEIINHTSSTPNCIYPKCYTYKKTPKIINIDNILSSCFEDHNSELYEMLKIKKKGGEKKFSKFSSVFIKDGKVNEYNLEEAYQETSSPTKGGRTKHKRRRKSKKATKKRKRRSRNRR
jgi:hypothetical protein